MAKIPHGWKDIPTSGSKRTKPLTLGELIDKLADMKKRGMANNDTPVTLRIHGEFGIAGIRLSCESPVSNAVACHPIGQAIQVNIWGTTRIPMPIDESDDDD